MKKLFCLLLALILMLTLFACGAKEETVEKPAWEGKFAVGDIVRSITIDGTRIEVQRKFQVIENMFRASVGSTVVFEIERNGQSMTLSFTITEDMVTLM